MTDEEDEASKTILGAAVKRNLPINDDLIELAKEVQRQKEATVWFRFKRELATRIQMIVSAALTALTAATIYFFDWIKDMFSD